MTYQDKAGRYVRVSIEGPTLRGNRQFEFKIRYWSSSSQVWNNYGQDIIARFATTAETKEIVVGTLWGNSLSSYLESNMWQTTYTYTAPSNVNFIDVVAITKSRDNDGEFYAQTDGFRVAQCYATSPNITNTSANSCTLSTNIYNPFDEEFKYQDAQGNYQVKNLSASSSVRAVSFTVNNMPPNSAYSNRYYGMILPNGSSNSFYAWNDSGTYKIRTSFSQMSMPKITVSRDSSNPTRLNVSWPAGGIVNKPTGDASRIQYVVAIEADKNGTLNMNNIKWGSTINLEVAGSGYIDNVDIDKGLSIEEIFDEKVKERYTKEYNQALNKIINNDSKDIENIDYSNITMKRVLGRWRIVGKLGATETFNKDFIFSILPNKKLINFNMLYVPWKTLKGELVFFKDAFTSPEAQIMLVQFNNYLSVYKINNGMIEESPLANIPIYPDEEIIMTEWCGSSYVDQWERIFLNGEIIE